MERFLELSSYIGNPGSIHREGVAAKQALEAARAEVARALRSKPHEVLFTSGGTEGNALALLGSFSDSAGHLVVSPIEHPSVLECAKILERRGVAVSYLSVSREGLIDPGEIRTLVRPDTRLISVQYVNSEIGVVQPLRDIAKVIRELNRSRPTPLIFHTDASQAPLYLSCNTERLHIDLMTLDAQKIGGVRGAGALFIRKGVSLAPLFYGGGQERGVRPGTEPVALAGAFARALTLAAEGSEVRAERLTPLRDLLIERLTVLSGVYLNGSREARIANNVNVAVRGADAEEVVLRLDAKGVAVSSRSACAAEEGGASPVIEALGESWRSRSSVRITLLPRASRRDVLAIARAFEEVLARMRREKV